VKAGVKLARALGARVTGISVMQPYLAAVYSDATMYMTASAVADYEKATRAQATKALGVVERAAAAAGVRATTHIVGELQPWQGILKAARKAGCDAIVMASHGHGGLGSAILGSQTSRVLSHSKIPVLVIR
jgi:nucleotide-binding universal stress UspA family protein